MKRSLFITLAALCCTLVMAKTPQAPDSYNYQRGIELINNDELDDGIDYLLKELENNPKNGYASAWLASAYSQKDERGTAIHYLEEAQKNLPKSAKKYLAWSYSLRAQIYLEMEDTINGIKAFNSAIRIQPDNEDWYEYRGKLYRELKNWSASDADFRKYIDLTPGLIRGHLLLAYNLYLQGRYQEALKINQFAHQLAERSFTYSAMAECEVKLDKWEDAVEHIIKSLELESYEGTAVDIIGDCRNPEFIDLLQTALKAQTLKNPNSTEWLLYQVLFYRANLQYPDAICASKKAREINPDPFMDQLTAELYSDFGDWNNALKYINLAIEGDSTEDEYLQQRAEIYFEMGNNEAMMQDVNAMVERSPEDENSYLVRGGKYFIRGNYTQAIEDYNLALAINKDLHWTRYLRARALAYTGDTAKAQREYERILENKTSLTVRMFAMASLERKQEALALADSILKEDSISNLYNISCIYALVGEKELAMQYITKALKKGYVEFHYMSLDPDFNALHGEEFDQLIATYQLQCQERIRAFNQEQGESSSEEKVVEIPFTAANGVTKVDCTINGLPLNFVFDTGASDVTLSLTEANFMFKNGYLKAKDIVGKQAYQTADGSIAVGTTFIIEHINFGGLELNNVQASVVQNQKAPLLLGQTVLKRLGRIEIDNEKRILRITTTK